MFTTFQIFTNKECFNLQKNSMKMIGLVEQYGDLYGLQAQVIPSLPFSPFICNIVFYSNFTLWHRILEHPSNIVYKTLAFNVLTLLTILTNIYLVNFVIYQSQNICLILIFYMLTFGGLTQPLPSLRIVISLRFLMITQDLLGLFLWPK